MPLPRETLKTASPEGDTEDPQYPTHNGFMARRVQKAPHASPEGGTEDPQYPTHRGFMVGLTLWKTLIGGRPVALPSSSASGRRRRRPVTPFAHRHRPWPPSAVALPAHV